MIKTTISFGAAMISSLELMDKTGISRATLNNYIKLGILPKPVVKKPEDKKIRAKKIGFYPVSVLDRIKLIKALKQEGYSMTDIVSKLQGEVNESSLKDMELQSKNQVKRSINNNDGLQAELFPLEDDMKSEELIDDELHYGSINYLLKNISGQIIKRKRAIKFLSSKNEPVLVHFSILAAKLQDAKRLQAELIGDEYSDLMNQILKISEDTLSNYLGLYGKNYGTEIIYYYFKNINTNYLIDPVVSSIELINNMNIISDQWRRKKGWTKEIFLNIGIAEGYDYLNIMPSLHSLEFITASDAIIHAEKLSSFASNGSIWITKNLLNKLNASERKKIHFGIKIKDENDKGYIENIFTRILDRSADSNSYHDDYIEVSTLLITEIIGMSQA